jgi:quinol-cytochrome oxidoreductase complex cytochrome b subunit
MRLLLILLPIALLVSGCSQPVGQMSQQDYQVITNVIRAVTSEHIIDIRLHDDSVIVDTSRERTVDHCYELQRTRDGWKIVWKGT